MDLKMNEQYKTCIKKRFNSVSETESFANRFSSILKKGDLLLFTGKIGAGKTTFIKSLAKSLGVTEDVTSPTFVLHTLYDSGRIQLSHVDLYRLFEEREVEEIGFEDYFDSSITTIEWADRYTGFYPPYLVLDFEYGTEENERILTISANGGDWGSRLSSIA